jgi:transcriptional regulator with XRE-family HTH domain
VENREEVRDFLSSRRARLTPESAGLDIARGRRRVTGLRRGEVADLAGVSVEYYARLERGNLRGASDEVLDALARALRMDEAEREHLFDLARAAGPASRPRRRRTRPLVSAPLQHLLDAVTDAAAFVRNGRLDVLATNVLARALYDPVYRGQPEPVNLARFCFLDSAASKFYPDWKEAADITVALLRTEAGRDPYDKDLSDLVGELSTRSADFGRRWAAHDVRLHRSGTKHFLHPVVGRLDLDFGAFVVTTDSRLTLTAYTAPPASSAADALALLASWAATASRSDSQERTPT